MSGHSIKTAMTPAQYNSDDLRVFWFHIGTRGESQVAIWATSQKHAIERFRAINPDVTFMTDAEWNKRQIQREKAIPLMAMGA